MSHPSVHEDPATVNEENPRATLGNLYYWAGAPGNSSAAPPGVYRYVQIKDIAGANGYSYCADAEAGISMQKATADRSADLSSVACIGCGVGTVTADYHTYILVKGRHQALLTDTNVGAANGLIIAEGSSEDGLCQPNPSPVSGTAPGMVFGYALEADSSAGVVSADIDCF